MEGVSTRRVDDLVRALGCEGISASQVSRICSELDEHVRSFLGRPSMPARTRYIWVDALAQSVREEARVVQVAVVVATGVNADGRREILGSDIGTSWQRCRTHFMRNLLTRVPKSAKKLVAAAVRSICEQPSGVEVRAQHARVVDQLTPRFPHPAEMLTGARDEILASMEFPTAHWRQIWSNNPQERVDREMRRRTDVVGSFPNRPATIRLIGLVLAEQNDEWMVSRRYMTMVTSVTTPAPPIPSGREVLLEAAQLVSRNCKGWCALTPLDRE